MVQLLADVISQLPMQAARTVYTRQFHPYLTSVAVVLSRHESPLWVTVDPKAAELLVQRGGVPPERVFTVQAVKGYAACFGTRLRSFKSAALAMDWADDGIPPLLEGGS